MTRRKRIDIMRHELKSLRRWFFLHLSGEMFWEIRVNDRDFRAGDEILLREYSQINNVYSGRELLYSVSHVFIHDDMPSVVGLILPKDVVILSLAPLDLGPIGPHTLSDPRD